VATTSATDALVGLPGVKRRVFWALGLGAFGLAFSLTTTAAYLPPLLHRFTSSGGLIGVVLGAEGIFALTLSPVIGPWSDTFHTPMGRRRPFMLVAVFPIGFCLLLMPFMPNLWTTVVIVMSFFFAYYLYETPYRGLYPDVLPAETFGRSQSVQHIQRGIAIGIALVGGGLLFKVWRPAPFVLAAILTTAACGLTILLVREDGGHGRVFEGFVAYIKRSWHIFWADGDVRRFLLANSAWEGTFAAARTFVVLYIIDGLHQSKVMSSAVLGAVATGYVIAAIFAGRLGDRFGLARVIFFASFVLPADPRGLDRGRHRDDACLGAAVQDRPRRTPGSCLGSGDDDEGHRAAHRRSGRGTRHRPGAAVPTGDRRLSGSLADLRPADPRRDPAARSLDGDRAADESRGRGAGRLSVG
jgi:MFS family permease